MGKNWGGRTPDAGRMVRSTVIHGIAASEGCAIGRVFEVEERRTDRREKSALTPEEELARLDRAVEDLSADLAAAGEDARRTAGEAQAEIFQVHVMLLREESFLGEARERIKAGETAEHAALAAGEQLARMFETLDDDYMKARAADFRDIAAGVADCLTGGGGETVPEGPVILAADELTPNQLLKLSHGRILALVTRRGSAMSHASILARSLGIPAVAGAAELPRGGEEAVVDGTAGLVIWSPTAAEKADYGGQIARQAEEKVRRAAFRDKPGRTADGRRIETACNIAAPEEVSAVLEQGGEGIGLFRSEFLFIGRTDPPSEEEQEAAYSSVLRAMGGKRVVIRTLDIGADKQVPYFNGKEEENPALGERAIRFALSHEEVFRTQLRALLRASAAGQMAVMFPLIVSENEVRRARALLEEEREALRREKVPMAERIEVGIMIETPAAALLSGRLAELVDFFSIGTNDLTQYTLAVDRGNQRVAGLYDTAHPAVVGLIRRTVENAHAHGIWVGICGESASDRRLLETYAALGVDELSVSPAQTARVKEALAGLDSRRCRILDHV